MGSRVRIARLVGVVWIVFVAIFTVPATTQGAPAPKTITLEFPSWQWDEAGYKEYYREAVAEFTRGHPSVVIKPIPLALAAFTDQSISRCAAANPPAILKFWSGSFQKLAAAGWLEPLDERLKGTDIRQNWVPAMFSEGQYEGQTFGVFNSGFAWQLFYNKRMFNEAGVKVPTTPDEFLKAAKTLTKDTNGDGIIDQYGYAVVSQPLPEIVMYGVGRFWVGWGGNIAKAGKPNATSSEVRRATAFMKELLDAKVVPPGIDRIRAREFFWRGKAAMMIEGPWVVTTAQAQNPSIVPDIGVAPIPFPHQAAAPSSGFGIPVAIDPATKELVWEWIKMITSSEWMQKYAAMTGTLPVRKGTVTAATIASHPWLKQFSDSMASALSIMPEGMSKYDSEISKIYADNTSDVFFGQKPIDKALQEVQAAMERLK